MESIEDRRNAALADFKATTTAAGAPVAILNLNQYTTHAGAFTHDIDNALGSATVPYEGLTYIYKNASFINLYPVATLEQKYQTQMHPLLNGHLPLSRLRKAAHRKGYILAYRPHFNLARTVKADPKSHLERHSEAISQIAPILHESGHIKAFAEGIFYTSRLHELAADLNISRNRAGLLTADEIRASHSYREIALGRSTLAFYSLAYGASEKFDQAARYFNSLARTRIEQRQAAPRCDVEIAARTAFLTLINGGKKSIPSPHIYARNVIETPMTALEAGLEKPPIDDTLKPQWTSLIAATGSPQDCLNLMSEMQSAALQAIADTYPSLLPTQRIYSFG